MQRGARGLSAYLFDAVGVLFVIEIAA